MTLSSFLVFIFGVSIGSFLNCVIYWLEKEKRANLGGRSFCPFCGRRLNFFDLIPVLSFFLLRGKCRYCGAKISWQYPLVEVMTGIVFWQAFRFQPVMAGEFFLSRFLNLIYLWTVFSILIIVFVYDLKHYLIPTRLVYFGTLAVFLFKILDVKIIGSFKPLRAAGLGGLAAGLFFFLIWAISAGKWLGFGDVNLAFLVGAFVGPARLFLLLFSAFLIGAIIGLVFVFAGRKEIKSEIPFGPFLVMGTFIALFWGEKVAEWYFNLMI